MKKPLALRIEPDLLDAARECARRDNRSLTNFIETALRDRIARLTPVGALQGQQGTKDTMRDA
ncbi:YlcI/YnfO family protein [Methylobacterium sp. J-068]|uniref:YlcI/YnfO family protein n=1 Tax=Methylobacterium sp. J-068 TaxID=2836649 RepID=UPI001FBC038C|nr:YlcI/YnfO family protein [Methylobacterium sp. J-068]MCJ2033379.1 DUF6364 family protein [Methylobacterium sp. J-068]